MNFITTLFITLIVSTSLFVLIYFSSINQHKINTNRLLTKSIEKEPVKLIVIKKPEFKITKSIQVNKKYIANIPKEVIDSVNEPKKEAIHIVRKSKKESIAHVRSYEEELLLNKRIDFDSKIIDITLIDKPIIIDTVAILEEENLHTEIIDITLEETFIIDEFDIEEGNTNFEIIDVNYVAPREETIVDNNSYIASTEEINIEETADLF